MINLATTGSFDFNLDKVSNLTNNTTSLGANVTGEVAAQGDLIGLAIAISIALTLIFGVVFLAIAFLPKLLGKVKGLK